MMPEAVVPPKVSQLVLRTVVVPEALAGLAARLCGELAGTPGEGMFVSALGDTPDGPVTHRVSSGWISDSFAPALEDWNTLYGACYMLGIEVTPEECQELIESSFVSDGAQSVVNEEGESVVIPQEPLAFIASLGLQMNQPPF